MYSRPSIWSRLDEISLCHGFADRGAADDFAVYLHGLDSDDIEVVRLAESLEQRKVSGASLAERPFVPDANFLKRPRVRRQLAHEIFRCLGCECAIEMQDEKMRDPEIADERDLVLRRGQQVRRVIRPQHFGRMRIERNHDRRSSGFLRVLRRSGNDGLMAEMNAIERANGEKERAGQSREIGDRTKNVQANDE